MKPVLLSQNKDVLLKNHEAAQKQLVNLTRGKDPKLIGAELDLTTTQLNQYLSGDTAIRYALLGRAFLAYGADALPLREAMLNGMSNGDKKH